MSGGVLNINGTQTPDIKNYFSPPPLSRSGADDQALRSRLEEMGIHSDSYTASASRFKKNDEDLSPGLRSIVLGGIDNAWSATALFNGLARKHPFRCL